jgi:hypothetical protein
MKQVSRDTESAIQASPDDEKQKKQQQLTHRRSPFNLGKLFVMEISRNPLRSRINSPAKKKRL